jgi:hypothetical protein
MKKIVIAAAVAATALFATTSAFAGYYDPGFYDAFGVYHPGAYHVTCQMVPVLGGWVQQCG